MQLIWMYADLVQHQVLVLTPEHRNIIARKLFHYGLCQFKLNMGNGCKTYVIMNRDDLCSRLSFGYLNKEPAFAVVDVKDVLIGLYI